MTTEEELKLLKLDHANLRHKLSMLEVSIDRLNDTFIKNMKRMLPTIWMSYRCIECLGTGKIYESPTVDCGQDTFGKCQKCDATGYMWK